MVFDEASLLRLEVSRIGYTNQLVDLSVAVSRLLKTTMAWLRRRPHIALLFLVIEYYTAVLI